MLRRVLDHGHVCLWDWMGGDISVVNAARTSFNKHQDEYRAQDQRLIKYLAKHNHWTPFAHVQLSIQFKMPLFVRSQWMKSNVGITYNEESRRYVDYVPDFYVPVAWRAAPEGSIKQGSGDFFDSHMSNELDHTYIPACHTAINTYTELMERGVAPELARMVLPQSMYTTFVMSASLMACIRLYKLRSKMDAQYEIRQYAEALGTICHSVAPDSWEAWCDDEE